MFKVEVALLILILSSLSMTVCSQTDGGVKIMPKQGDLYESTKQLNNPYFLPAWGERLGKKGFLLPYPIGVMINSYIGEQDVAISDLTIGINDADGNVIIPSTSLDQVVGFSRVKATVRNINARTDIWILPFLDVYGVFGKAWVETEVSIGSIANRPVDMNTQANFSGYVYGCGAMLTGGVRSIFFSLDFNTVWTHFDEMKKDNSAMNLAPRVGYIFHFNKQPERNFSLWTGAGRIFLNSTTVGSLALSDIAPDLGQNYENTDWYNALSPAVQKIADDVVANFVDKNKGDVVNYSLNKRPERNWCMILGAQYQVSRHWQFRVETNFLGGRRSGLFKR
ncbi:MAG: hypothetical protein LBV74_14845 [Tannerella sp.]|jgi:hypothetical protein|nr:hypothetical protein [Tannerella sp.]